MEVSLTGCSPESMGVVVGVVYFISMFLFIPVPFISWFNGVREEGFDFPHHKVPSGSRKLISST